MATKIIDSGISAPDFTIEDQDGKQQSLDSLMGKKGLVLYFYPKDMTPGCTQEACDFRDQKKILEKEGFSVAGISRDSTGLHQKFIEKHSLNFPLLSDASGEVCENYGVWREKMFMGKKHMGIVRATILIGKNKKIQKVYDGVKVNGHLDQILEDIRGK